MNKNELKFLTKYTQKTDEINRLVVSVFLIQNNVKCSKNKLINSLSIKKDDSDFSLFMLLNKKIKIKSLEDLIEVFEFIISPADKIVNGAVYTPEAIREYIVKNSINLEQNTLPSICDLACGCAGFLLTAANFLHNNLHINYRDIYKNQIYGVDIEKYAVERSKILLTLAAVLAGEDADSFEFNIFTGNALSFDWRQHCGKDKFDVIVGNPPYVCSRHLNDETLKLLKKFKTCNVGHPDLYIPFFEIGVEMLAPNGVLGFITMNTFFKSVNGRNLRHFLNSGELHLEILDFGSIPVFKSKSTYTCICIVKKKSSDFINYFRMKSKICFSEIMLTPVARQLLDNSNGWNLTSVDIIKKIENTGEPLGNIYDTSSGIATLKNDVYIFSPVRENKTFYFLQSDSVEYKIEKNVCTKIVNSNKISSEKSFSENIQYVIFPYDIETKKLLAEDFFKKNYPYAYKYLESKKAILRTRDKGKKTYTYWYAFGRNQGFVFNQGKLFFPHIATEAFVPVYCDDNDMLFYNGMAAMAKDTNSLLFLKKIMETCIFWFYILSTSKPYGTNHYSLAHNYIKKLGIPRISQEELNVVIEKSCAEFEKWLIQQYDLTSEDVKIIKQVTKDKNIG